MRMTHEEMIAVIAAHKEGKKIEFCRGLDHDWEPCENPGFDFIAYLYRVKPEPPEPREWWVIAFPDNSTSASVMGGQEQARKLAETSSYGGKAIRVREVLK